MKRSFFIFCALILLSSCNQETEKETVPKDSSKKTKELKDKKEDANLASKTVAPELIPETNFDSYKSKLTKLNGDHSKIENWLKKIVSMDKDRDFDGSTSYMTKECFNFVRDVMDFNWGYPGSIEEATFKSKWSATFDLNYTNYGHLFENGNGGWVVKKLTDIKYLGNLNDGEWFQLTIKGGSTENENKLIRVVKVIEKNNSFYLSNFLGISEN